MSPHDAWFLYADSARFRHAYVSAYAFAPEDDSGRLPRPEEAVRWIAERATLPVLRRRVVRTPLDLARPYWVEDAGFDAAEHIHAHDPMTWDGLRDFLAALATVPMDDTRPLWEVHVVARVDAVPGTSGPVTVVAVKIHHCAADGVASGEVTTALFGGDTTDPADDHGSRVPGQGELIARAVVGVPGGVGQVVAAARSAKAARAAQLSARESASYPVPPQRRTPTSLDGPVGPGRVYEVATFSLAEMQEVKARIGDVTINDLILTVVGGALRSYLVERGETPGGSLAASVPMTVRGTQPHSDSNNQFVMTVVDVNTEIVDPVARARAVHDAVLGERRRMTIPAEAEVLAIDFVLPGWMFRVARALERWRGVKPAGVVARPFNTFVTSVPRRTTSLRMLDTTAVMAFGTSTLDGTGTSHSVGSTGDVLALNITADPALLTDSRRYVELIRLSYTELRDAAFATVPG
ncbi:wax ester/triacylglycerol synthase domain-containing protein [Rhodococcus gannanensis]|uniref:diacylglycerol O-acyltransferase n=1 Tax=Rhodococcus gannanensis TaxID=1960308 RepID=A0ABW4PA42_9NOCA